MRSALALALTLSLAAWASPAVIRVPGDYSTIQDAIDAALPGDTVLVAPGTYPERIDFLGKAIRVEGEAGAGATCIDGGGGGSVVTMKSGEGPDAVLSGFTLTHGKAEEGGGIFCENASPTITGNVVAGNEGTRGGAIFCRGASPLVENNLLCGNEVYRGGGLYCEQGASPLVKNNQIFDNKNSAYK
jgi:hypothetical protein